MMTHEKLQAGCGKFGPTFQYLEENNVSKAKLYVFSRAEIESLDLRRFLQEFSPRKSREDLRAASSQWHFVVDGYDDVPEELFEIPAVRKYFSLATSLLPIWSFAAATSSPALWGIVFSVLPNLQVRREGGEVQVAFDGDGVVRLYQATIPVFRLFAELAGLSPGKVDKKLNRLARYLGILK